MKKKLFLAGIFLIGLSIAMVAQPAPWVGARQGNQHARIMQGRVHGELTRREAFELRRQQHRIQRHKRSVKADGVVTPRERAGLRMHQNKVNRDICRKSTMGGEEVMSYE
jgi:hypothetical protein